MLSVVDNKFASSYQRVYTNLQSRTQCLGFFTQTSLHNTDGPFLFARSQEDQHRILFQKVCLR